MKCLAEGAYTIEEANAAGGSGTSGFYSKRIEKIQGLQESLKEKNYKKISKPESSLPISESVSIMTYE